MRKNKTTEEFKKEVYEKVGEEYTVLGEYINSKTLVKMRHNCDECNNYIFEMSPNCFLRGQRCKICSNRIRTINQTKSYDTFVQEVKTLSNGEYTVLGEYINNKTPIKMRHNSCGYEWEITPNSFLRGTRCPMCMHKQAILKQTKGHDIFITEVEKMVSDEYSVLGEYVNANTKIKMRHNCDKCNNYEWDVTPNSFLNNNNRCPYCAGKIKKTVEQFKQEVFESVGQEYTVLGTYVNFHTKIKIRHNSCGYEWDVIPNSFINRKSRCPKCSGLMKKTTKQFKKEVEALVGQEYVVLGEYVNTHTKIRMQHNCDECNNYIFEMTPDCFLRGTRCKICSRKQATAKVTKSQEQFIKEVYNLIGDEYAVLGKYINSATKIKMKHNICGHIWDVKPANFICNNSRCPKCSSNASKGTENFKKEVFKLVGDEYEVIGKYINAKTKIRIRHNCDKCNNFEWDVFPTNFLRGNRCYKCSGNMKKTPEQFKQEMYKKLGKDYSVLGEYINSSTKIKMKHNTCGHEWDVLPSSLIQGTGCPICGKQLSIQKKTKSQEQFEKEVYNLTNGEYSVIGKYENTYTKIRMKHNICGHIYKVRPTDFLCSAHCAYCNQSKNEKKITTYLENNNINFDIEYRLDGLKNKIPLRFDFAIFDKSNNLKLLIEYHGEQHFKIAWKRTCDSEKRLIQRLKNDQLKIDYCKEHNIEYLFIPYTEDKNIEEILQETLTNLGLLPDDL